VAASFGPLLDAVMVNVTGLPTPGVVGLAVWLRVRSALAGAFNAATAVLLDGLGSGSVAITVAVFKIDPVC
jgi:hypothetical protein